MMLRKRTRSHQKEQRMNNLMACAVSDSYFHSDVPTQKQKNGTFLNVPGLFVGFIPKSSESDSAQSPTSPLDFRIFSGFGYPLRCPRVSQNEGHQKSWDCQKVGLSIVDSLSDEGRQSGKVAGPYDNKMILFGRQMNVKSQNLCGRVASVEKPKAVSSNIPTFNQNQAKSDNVQEGSSDVVFEIGEVEVEQQLYARFLDHSPDIGGYGSSGSYLPNFVPWSMKNPMPSESRFLGGSFKLGVSSHSFRHGAGFISAVPASEIELSEDYTCVRTHGSNPNIVHIFGDCILECHSDQVIDIPTKGEEGNDDTSPETGGSTDVLASYTPNNFLKFCYSCRKELDGQDIYMYRGEKPFCSKGCRAQEIEKDKDMEIKTDDDPSEAPDEPNPSLHNW